jgi:poly-gamma-glutamate capsule biosynthesis protein CapA/YwtB (metallophosphatase superfamily)
VSLLAVAELIAAAVIVGLAASALGGSPGPARAAMSAVKVNRPLPAWRAPGGRVTVAGRATPGAEITLQALAGGKYTVLGRNHADHSGFFRVGGRIPEDARGRVPVRVSGPAGAIVERTVTVRPVVLAAVGDVNLADRAGELVQSDGARYPWASVAPLLRTSDVSLANLECAVSQRGAAVPKLYNFKADPAALPAAHLAGLDVVNLANNHSGDFGDDALLDTLAAARGSGLQPVGAGRDEAAAARPVVVTRAGLRIAFVGFVDVLPSEFAATPDSPGTNWATPAHITAAVKAARRQADVVVATFHWGVELQSLPDSQQLEEARIALQAGADAIIGGHPHVLQPVLRSGRKLVAYSMGNFVFDAHSGATTHSGILRVGLSGRGVESAHFQPVTIDDTKPAPSGRARNVPANTETTL